MKEILLAILLPQLFVLPLILALRASKKGGGGPDENKTETDDGWRVFEILRGVYLDLNRQHAAAYGPWISSALEHKCGDPGIALTAVQFTIRDLLNLPVGEGVEYVKGVEFRFNLDGLRSAEKELLKMKEGEGVCS